MFKKILAAAVVLALVFAMAAPAMAIPSGVVGRYTPTIDGVRDAAYELSHSFNIFDQYNTQRGEGWWSTHGNVSTDMDANIWFLWDDDFLYAYVEVTQPEVLNIGDDHILNHENPWEANSVELWVLWDDFSMALDRLKTSIEPFHNRQWGDGPPFDDIDLGTEKIARFTDTGYSAEFAIPIPSDFLVEGGQGKFTLQVNVWDGEGSIPVGLQIQDAHIANVAVLTFGGPVAMPEPEPEPEPAPVEAEAAPEPEAAPEAVQAAEAEKPAPPTADPITLVILGSLAAAGAAGTLVARKRR